MTSRLDNTLTAAIRAATHHKLSYFYHSLVRHRKHDSFDIRDYPRHLETGFVCGCSGSEREWRVSLRTLQEALPEAREAFMRFRSSKNVHGRKAQKKKWTRSERKAKALLYRFLTKEQKWDLRASNSFGVVGKDGRVYRLSRGSCSYIENGEPRYSLCVVPKHESIPMYDLMLAHKILLETDPEQFLRTAHATDLETRDRYPSAGFIFSGESPIPNEVIEECHEVIRLPNEVLDDPRQWIEEQLHESVRVGQSQRLSSGTIDLP